MPDTPSLTVTKQTTVEDLKAFASRAGDDAKIKGKIDKETGNTILYVGKKSPGLFSMLTGSAARRRERAKEAFQDIIDNSITKTAQRKLGTKEENAIRTLSSSVHQRTGELGDHRIKGGFIYAWASAVHGSEHYGKEHRPDGGPTLAMLGEFGPKISELAPELKTAIDNGESLKSKAESFGDAIAEQFLARHPDTDDRFMFATGTGREFKASLLDAFKSEIGGKDGEAFVKSDEFRQFLDVAFNRAASKMLPNGEVPGTEQTLRWTDKEGKAQEFKVSAIVIDGVTYQPERHLGTGGYAHVFSYKATDGSDKRIAYKVALETTPEALAEVSSETRAHRALSGDGDPNVIKLEGVIRYPDGRIGIAMESAPGGDVFDFSKKLKDLVGEGPGKVAPDLADLVRLRLLKDIVQGTDHIQNESGGYHGDLKSPNVMIGTNGTAKLADFGLSQVGTTFKLETTPTPDNPAWLSPELTSIQKGSSEAKDLKTPGLISANKEWKAELARLLPGLQPKSIEFLAKNVLQTQIHNEVSEYEFTNKVDSWAVGVIAHDLWKGEVLLTKDNYQFGAHAQARISDFKNNLDNRAIGETDAEGRGINGALAGTTGNTDVDAMINKIMHPDANERPEMTDLLNDPLLSNKSLDLPEVRTLIEAINSGDARRIDLATAGLLLALRD